MLENTKQSITANFPGEINRGLRALLNRVAYSIARGENINTDLMFIGSKVALTATGKAALARVNSTFVQEISSHAG